MSTRPATLAGLSVEVARRRLAREFGEQNIDAPALDARIIVGHVLGLDHAALMAQSGRVLAPAEADAIAALAARRHAHEPVARMLGHKEFWGLPLKLNATRCCRGRKPRPWSRPRWLRSTGEHRSARVLRIARPRHRLGRAAAGAALGAARTRSGSARISASTALGCARDNAAALGLSAACVVRGVRLRGSARRAVDLSSPIRPMWRARTSPTLQPEVREFDPRRALDGGPGWS